MKKIFIIVLSFILIFAGCATSLKKNNNGIASQIIKMFSLSDSDKNASIIAGLGVFEDKRPQQEVAYLTSIKEKASENILSSIKDTQLFDDVHYPALDNDNIVISGEIRKFGWQSEDTMISYIPGLNILPFLGLPSNNVHSEVEIYVEVKNKKANVVILGFIESCKKDKKFNIYNFQTAKAEEDLASCFKIVLDRIKEKIIINRNVILDTVKLGISEPVKPVEVQEPAIAPLGVTSAAETQETPAAEVVPAEPPAITADTTQQPAQPQ